MYIIIYSGSSRINQVKLLNYLNEITVDFLLNFDYN